jgi:hypothetical protein
MLEALGSSRYAVLEALGSSRYAVLEALGSSRYAVLEALGSSPWAVLEPLGVLSVDRARFGRVLRTVLRRVPRALSLRRTLSNPRCKHPHEMCGDSTFLAHPGSLSAGRDGGTRTIRFLSFPLSRPLARSSFSRRARLESFWVLATVREGPPRSSRGSAGRARRVLANVSGAPPGLS